MKGRVFSSAVVVAVAAAGMAAAAGVAAAGTSPHTLATTTTTSSPATTAQQAISVLNAQRTANGLPAGITENPTWSSDCLMHDEYMSMNGHLLTHTEVQGNPGYSTGGAFAGENSVLAQGATWADGNPYEHAPLHLDQLLAPELDLVGSADAEGFSCTTTYPGWTRPTPAALTIYTYPGPGATIYASETAREQPFTPGSLVGLGAHAKTGPNLFVFVEAPGQGSSDNPAKLSGAVLSGPSGTVPVVTADGDTAIPRGDQTGCQGGTLSCFIAPGGFIVPVRPLRPQATYHVHVVVTFAGVSTPHDWTFVTAGLLPESSLTLSGRRLRFRSRSRAPIVVKFTRPGGHAPSHTISPGHGYSLSLPPGSWLACGTQAQAGRYAGYKQCLTILVTGQPKLSFGSPSIQGTKVRFPIRFSPVLRGRTATLTVTSLHERCGAGGHCTAVAGARTTRTITLRADAIRLPLPAQASHGYRLKLATAAFELRDVPWLAADATSKPFIER